MAITKTHSIKSTVNLAIDYICNPDKTDGQVYISSYGCSPQTADIEFKWTREKARSAGTILARHLIQSFEPNETTPEQAHEIGKRLADEVLGGKYEYVLSTHIDKGHVHNHIIFNSVSFTDHKKYCSTKRNYREIRRISDSLCKEYGLSVIEPSNNKGKSYVEHAADKNGVSWKSQLRTAIDKNIIMAKDFDSFLNLMERDGYKVKRQNKNVSFCADGRERYMRSKTLGEKYTVDAIIDRIAGQKVLSIPKQEDNSIRRLIDLTDNDKGKGFEYWAKINNLKQSAKTLNFLTEHNIRTYKDLEKAAVNARQEFDGVSAEIKDVEKNLSDTALLIKSIQTYAKLKSVYTEYKNADNKDEYRERHRAEITLYEAAYKELKAANFPKIKDLKKSHSELTKRKAALYKEYRQARATATELETAKSNIDNLLNIKQAPAREKSNELE